MISTKSLSPVGQCQTIREIYREHLREFEQVTEARRDAGDQVEALNHQFFAAGEASERQRISDDQNAAFALFERLTKDWERSRLRLGDVRNAYIITGCGEVLGEL